MAKTSTVGVEFRAYNRSQSGLRSFARSMQRAERLVYSVAGAYLSGRGLIGAARLMTQAHIEQERATNRLNTLMGNVPGTTQQAVSAMMRYTEQLQKYTTIGDDVGQVGASQLATFQLQADTIKTLLPNLYDLATAVYGAKVSQEQMITVGNLLGKAMLGQVGALTRYGVTVTDAQAKVLKLGNEQQKAAAMSEILEANFGGLAASVAQTSEGQFQQLNNILSDTADILGESLVDAMVKASSGLHDWLSNNQGVIKRWANDWVEGAAVVARAMNITTPKRDKLTLEELFNSFGPHTQKQIQMQYQAETGGDFLGYQQHIRTQGFGAVFENKWHRPKDPIRARAMMEEWSRMLSQKAGMDSEAGLNNLRERLGKIGVPLAPGKIGAGAAGVAGSRATGGVTATASIAASERMMQAMERELSIIGRLGDSHERAAKMIDFETAVKAEYANDLDKQHDLISQYAEGLERLEKQKDLVALGKQFGDTWGSALEDFAFRAKTAGEAAGALAMDIAKLFFRQAVTQPIQQAMSNAFIGAFQYHDGGVVPFGGVPRLHGGLRPDEFPAILQTGETVLPRGAGSHVTLINQSGRNLDVGDVEFDPRRGVTTIILEDLDRNGPIARALRGSA